MKTSEISLSTRYVGTGADEVAKVAEADVRWKRTMPPEVRTVKRSSIVDGDVGPWAGVSCEETSVIPRNLMTSRHSRIIDKRQSR
jgi:hypothetical protein